MRNSMLIMALCTLLQSCTESRVESKAYDAMLNVLLSHSADEITVADLQGMPDALLLDAREIDEFNVSHIKGARWIGYDAVQLNTVKDVDKTQAIVVYCSVGYRSEKIAEKLKSKGFQNVHNLYGGIFEWVNQRKTVVDTLMQPTDRVHAFDRTWGIWLSRGEKVY